MTNPFEEMSDLCAAYASAYAEFKAVQTALDQLKLLAEGKLTEEQYQAEATIAQARITFLTPLNDLIVVEAPVTKAVLQPAVTVISARLAGLVRDLNARSGDATKIMEKVQCPPANPTTTGAPTSAASTTPPLPPTSPTAPASVSVPVPVMPTPPGLG